MHVKVCLNFTEESITCFFHSYIFSIVLRNTNIKLFIYFLRKEEIGIPLN